jgi:hypothetical protein
MKIEPVIRDGGDEIEQAIEAAHAELEIEAREDAEAEERERAKLAREEEEAEAERESVKRAESAIRIVEALKAARARLDPVRITFSETRRSFWSGERAVEKEASAWAAAARTGPSPAVRDRYGQWHVAFQLLDQESFGSPARNTPMRPFRCRMEPRSMIGTGGSVQTDVFPSVDAYVQAVQTAPASADPSLHPYEKLANEVVHAVARSIAAAERRNERKE